jgi:uncharacterized protein
MPPLYHTPGVYIEEISKFPPSIIPAETAVPAFIGYTEKALLNGQSLLDKPLRIGSLARYEEFFGGAPAQNITIYLDKNNGFNGAQRTGEGFLLYDSLRMFYANGGGDCYIVSVGLYESHRIAVDGLSKGLDAIGSEDGPTILLFPDAVSLSGATALYDVQKKALKQCGSLGDRVMLCDLKYANDTNVDFNELVDEFRVNIGIDSLKYGAAYAPWLITSFSRTLCHRNITLKQNDSAGTEIELRNLITDVETLKVLYDLLNAEKALNSLKESQASTVGSGRTPEECLEAKSGVYDANPGTRLAELENDLRGIYDLPVKLLAGIGAMISELPVISFTPLSPAVKESTRDFQLGTDIDRYIANSGLKAQFDALAAHYNYHRDAGNTGKILLFSADPADPASDLAKAIILLGYGKSSAASAGAFRAVPKADYLPGANDREKADCAKKTAVNASEAIIAFFLFAEKTAAEYEKKFNESLLEMSGTYREIVSKATEFSNSIPPGGAIAGMYASVDRDRGVWKAAANVSLTEVKGIAVKISQEQQGRYNVDVNEGKSINIIRDFQEKGLLVWGARTLACNDNEWRYVNVCRFFNFVEKSTKKSTEQFVFEPNDANTWVKIRAMIENFLTTLWREGALLGEKPEHAFYVAVGLGKTMTALDIREGRLIVEIGMAAVCQAEFIILKFSHKMAES